MVLIMMFKLKEGSPGRENMHTKKVVGRAKRPEVKEDFGGWG